MKCPECGADEVEAMTPRTVYACGSSDYDQRPGSFDKGFKCKYGDVYVNEKERASWMNERMKKGYSFRFFKNSERINCGVFCVETKEEFSYIFEGAKNTEQQVQAD